MDMPEDFPHEVPWGEIERFDDLDVRVSAIDCLFANIVGVNDGYIEWCPNADPPSNDEYLAWLWVVKPSLGKEISSEAPADLRQLIDAYDANAMDGWFSGIANGE